MTPPPAHIHPPQPPNDFLHSPVLDPISAPSHLHLWSTSVPICSPRPPSKLLSTLPILLQFFFLLLPVPWRELSSHPTFR